MIEAIEGHAPRLHATSWVHPGAWVIGDVELGADVTIWPGAVLRGDMGPIRIGAGSNLQDGAICHDTGGISVTEVGERVTVGHRAVLHGCRIEDECLVGMGAIVLDNAVVGRGSLIGAGALVTSGVTIPPGSLVLGSPARVVRPVRPDERAWIDASWRIYVETRRRYRESAPVPG